MKSKLNETPQYLCAPSSGQSAHDEINIEYILSREMVIVQQNYICGRIGTSTTIIQFYHNKNDRWDRLDSQVSAVTMRTSCDLLRRCIINGEKLCQDCDTQHARLFHEMTCDKIEAGELGNKIRENQKKWNEIYHNPEYHNPQVEKYNNRIFLTYTCPMLGYRELIFPIFFEKKVVAVFFMGQMQLEDQEAVIKSNKENFFCNNPDIFNAYQKACNVRGYNKTGPQKYINEDIEQDIINKNKCEINTDEVSNLEQWLQTDEVQLSQEQYNEMLKITCEWLDDLEDMLTKEMRRKRENYSRYVLAEALTSFHADHADTDNSHPIHEALWTPVQAYTKKVTVQCAVEYMAVYGVVSIGEKEVSSLEIVALSNSELYSVVPVSFFLEDTPLDSMMDKPSDSRKTLNLFNALSPIPSDKEQSQMSIVFQPMKEISAASVAILVKYSNNTLKQSIEDALISGLQNLAALISLHLAVRFENAAQQSLKNTLRLYRHEIVILTSDVSRAIEYLGNPRLQEIESKKINDVYQDAKGTLNMFTFLSQNIGILINEPIPAEKKEVPIYHDLLYKWEDNKLIDARDKGCHFEFQKSHININTDPRYAEIVVYNLLSNAVKYAYDNTNIYIHCERHQLETKYILSVTNFTFTIEKTASKKIFEMGYRTQKAREYNPEGNGIGLCLVEKAMGVLGGDVKLCEPEWISDYNVPLLHTYVSDSDSYACISTVEDLKEARQEYDRLSNEYIMNDFGERQCKLSWVISKHNRYKPAKSMVQAELHKATYKIRFEVNFYG